MASFLLSPVGPSSPPVHRSRRLFRAITALVVAAIAIGTLVGPAAAQNTTDVSTTEGANTVIGNTDLDNTGFDNTGFGNGDPGDGDCMCDCNGGSGSTVSVALADKDLPKVEGILLPSSAYTPDGKPAPAPPLLERKVTQLDFKEFERDKTSGKFVSPLYSLNGNWMIKGDVSLDAKATCDVDVTVQVYRNVFRNGPNPRAVVLAKNQRDLSVRVKPNTAQKLESVMFQAADVHWVVVTIKPLKPGLDVSLVSVNLRWVPE